MSVETKSVQDVKLRETSDEVEKMSQVFMHFKSTINSLNTQIEIAKEAGIELKPYIKDNRILFNASSLY